MRTRPRTLAVAAAVGLLLTGCSSDPTPVEGGSPAASASASASPSVSASPSSTLSAAKQKAADEATEVVLAYEQMFYDLLADPEPYLNDLNNVAAQPQLDIDLRNLQGLVVAGNTAVESSGPVTIASVDPVKVDFDGAPTAVVLEVCVDRTATNGTEDGQPWTGPRELARYRVVKTTYLPDPGWAVAKVLPPKGYDQPQPC